MSKTQMLIATIVLTCLSLASTGMLMPDSNNPIYLTNNDRTLSGKHLKVRFMVPSASPGATSASIIGVDLSNILDSVSVFTASSFKCRMTDVTDPAQPLIFEMMNKNSTASNVALCEITDGLLARVIVPGRTYELSLFISTASIATANWNNVGLFTATSISASRYYIDRNKVFATVATYPIHTASTIQQPLILNSQERSIKVTAGSSTEADVNGGKEVFPGDTFRSTFSFEVKKRIPKDYDYIIYYDSFYFDGSSATVVSLDFIDGTSNNLEKAVTGTLDLELIKPGMLRILNIQETLIPGRKFKIRISGWVAYQKVVETARNISFYVFYKNSSTVFSYTQDSTLMSIKRVTLDTSVEQLDSNYWVVEGLSWPLRFKVKPNISMKNVHVKITANSNDQEIGFNAASCDFSATSSLQTTFGNKPLCHSLSRGYEGSSGFHFFIADMPNTGFIDVVVWTHFSRCGGSNDKNIKSNEGATSNYRFEMYTNLNNQTSDATRFPADFTSQLNESSLVRDNMEEAAYLLAKEKETTLPTVYKLSDSNKDGIFKCLPSVIAKPTFDTSTVNRYNSIDISGAPESGTVEYLIVQEISNIELYNTKTKLLTPNGYYNFQKNDSPFDPQVLKLNVGNTFGTGDDANLLSYLYESNSIQTDMPLAIVASISDKGTNAASFPSNLVDNTNVVPGFLQIVLQKKWFIKGVTAGADDTANDYYYNQCFTVWNTFGFAGNAKADIDFSTVLEIADDTTANKNNAAKGVAASASIATVAENKKRYMRLGKEIDSMNLPGDSTESTYNYYRITGKVNDGQANVYYTWPFVDTTTADMQGIGFYTSCLYLNGNVTKRSIFDHFELQMNYHNKDTNITAIEQNKLRRMIRFISFVPLSGLFSKFNSESLVKTDATSFNLIEGYYTYGNYSAHSQSVCMTVVKSAYYKTTNTLGNTFVLFLTGIDLFDTDFNSYSNNYPVGNLSGSTKAYAFGTAAPYKANDFRILNNESNNPTLAQTDKYYKLATIELADNITLASQIWFTGSSSNVLGADRGTTTATDLVIPHYCIEGHSSATDNQVVVFGAWLTANNYNDVSNLAKKSYINDTSVTPNVPLYSYIFMKADRIIKTDYSSDYLFANIKYSVFSSQTSSILLNGGDNTGLTGDIKATAVLTSDKISAIDGEVGSLGDNTIQRSTTNNFYFLGTKYTKALMGVHSGTVNISTGGLIISKIGRPNLAQIVKSDGVLDLPNTIVFSSILAGTDSSTAVKVYSNLRSVTNGAQKAFVSFTEESLSWVLTYTRDEGNIIYANTGRVAIDVVGPASGSVFPKGTPLGINISDTVTTNAFCAIEGERTNLAVPCTKKTGGFDCQVSNSSPVSAFKICCYNLNITTGTNFALGQVDVRYSVPADETSFANYNLYKKDTNLGGLTSVQNAAIPDPELKTIDFLYTQTNGGISTVLLKLDLQRGLNYNTDIKITGDFSSLSLYGEVPNCTATVNSSGVFGSWNEGDEIISGCSITNFETQTGTITISTKQKIFNCSKNYNRELFITLGPVQVKPLTNIGFLTTLSYAGGAAYKTPAAPFVPTVSSLNNTAFVADSTATNYTLCNLTTVYPAIVGAAASYTFRFDITSYRAQNTNLSLLPNEFAIFLPKSVFGEINGNDIYCSAPGLGSDIDCSIKAGALVANFKSATVNVDTVDLTVFNIKNPVIGLNTLNYSCSVNRLYNDNVRRVLAVGRGNYTDSVAIQANSISGFLAFDNSTRLVAPSFNPRKTIPEIQLGFIIDESGSHVTTSSTVINTATFTITNTPVFIVEFPHTYAISKYGQSAVTATIQRVDRDTSVETFTLKNPVTISTTSRISGNQIIISLSNSSDGEVPTHTFPTEAEYYLLKIQGLRGSEEKMVNSGLINFYLTNSTYSTIYRTYTNTNNNFVSAISPAQTGLVNFYRGFGFDFDQSEWVIDVRNMGSSQSNVVSLVAGFYSDLTIGVSSFAGLNPFSSEVNVSFVSPIIQNNSILGGSSVKVYSKDPVTNFKLGIPCSTSIGRYLVDVNVTESTPFKFLPVTKMIVHVTHSKRKILCNIPNISVPRNTATPFKCVMPQTIDDVSFEIVNKNEDRNTLAFTIEGLDVNFTFSSLDNSLDSTVRTSTFTVSVSNACLIFNDGGKQSRDISFEINEESIPSLVPTDLDNLSYRNKDDDSNLNYDQLSFSLLIPKYTSSHCVLVCTNLVFPSDEEILKKHATSNDPNRQYFTNYSTDSAVPVSSTLSGLRRRVNYKIRCLLKSSQIAETPDMITKIYDRIVKGNGTTIVQIGLPVSSNSVCANFSFTTNPSDEVKTKIITACQNTFTVNAGVSTGCIVCTDYDKKFFSVGASLSSTSCSTATALRSLQSESISSANSNFLVCATQDVLCSTQLESLVINERFDSFTSTLNTSEKVNKVLVGSSQRMLQSSLTLLKVVKIPDVAMPTFRVCTDVSQTEGCIFVDLHQLTFEGKIEFIFRTLYNVEAYWKTMEKGATTPTQAQIMNCDNERCGKIYAFDNVTKTVTFDKPNKFVRGKTFVTYITFKNFLVLNPNNSSNAVIELGQTSFATIENNCPKPELKADPASTDCFCYDTENKLVEMDATGSNCSSSFLTFGLGLLLVLSLLFN